MDKKVRIMVTLREYLQNPCQALSLPYWKSKQGPVPENIKIIHQSNDSASLLAEQAAEPYFRLIHHLDHTPREALKGFFIKTAGLSDIPQIVQIINSSYPDLSVDEAQMLSYTQMPAYCEDLWIFVYETRTHTAVGCGIADFDQEAREGVLEWIQVLPAWRRQGVGTLLVKELLCRIKEKQARFATVSGRADNPSQPEKLYRRCGFSGEDVWLIVRKN